MTLELWLVAGVFVLLLIIAGGTIGVGVFTLGLRTKFEQERKSALAEQAEAHKIEMREMVEYNSRLERRVSELEAQMVVAMQALRDARIPMPRSPAPVTFSAAGDVNVGGDVAGNMR